MSKFYNIRNSFGQFTRKVNRATDGKFSSPDNIVAGRLYSFKGSTVRALKKDTKGARLVSFHKTLFGFVQDSDLQKINKRKVNNYLAEVKSV
jgi:hypothetical protein